MAGSNAHKGETANGWPTNPELLDRSMVRFARRCSRYDAIVRTLRSPQQLII
jgi:hypothetical protein